ncbi:MAG: class I SAM-dependent methyltransferase [Aggregatilineales bacterium]
MINNMRQYYDAYWEQGGAGGYSTPGLRRWTEQRKSELLLSLRELKPGSLILDAGCGIGEFTVLIAKQGFRVIGIDIAALPLKPVNARFRETL